MNEQIRLLAEQARLLTGWPVGATEYQKFAELIIAECCDQVRAIDAMTIRQHFGVDE